jgi:hypothetical protein
MTAQYARRLAGSKSQRTGASFERWVVDAFESRGWDVVRIADGCRVVGKGKLLRVAQPFDFVAVMGPMVVFFDAKARDLVKLRPSVLGTGTSTTAQAETLKALGRHGHPCGFLVLLKPVSELWWIPADWAGDVSKAVRWGTLDNFMIQFP